MRPLLSRFACASSLGLFALFSTFAPAQAFEDAVAIPPPKLDVKDASGTVANWNFELASPNVLIRNGWHRNSIKPGDMVTVTGVQAKDSSNYASAGGITFPDGHKLTFLAADNEK